MVNVAGAKTLLPKEATPPAAVPGTEWVPVTINRNPGQYDQFNQPHLNIHEAAAQNDNTPAAASCATTSRRCW